MTARERQPARAVPAEWQHIVPIATVQRPNVPPLTVPATGAVTRSSVTRGAISVSRDSIDLRMDVYGSDGEHVGRVKDLGDAEFLVGRRWRADTRVPLDRVLAVIDQRVILTVSDHASHAAWNGEM